MNNIAMVIEGLIYAVGVSFVTLSLVVVVLIGIAIVLDSIQNVYNKYLRVYSCIQLVSVMKQLEKKGKAKLIEEIKSDK